MKLIFNIKCLIDIKSNYSMILSSPTPFLFYVFCIITAKLQQVTIVLLMLRGE